MASQEIIEKLDSIIDFLSGSLWLVILCGVIAALLAFLLFVGLGILIFKVCWRRNEFQRFERNRKDNRTDMTVVGWNRIYRPPESRHGFRFSDQPVESLVSSGQKEGKEIEFTWSVQLPQLRPPPRYYEIVYDRV